MAEGVGFEPTVRLPVRLISSQVPLTTQPPFRTVFTGLCALALTVLPPPNRTTLLTNYRQSYARIESYTTPGPLQAKRHLLGQDPGPIHEGDLAHRRFSVWAAG